MLYLDECRGVLPLETVCKQRVIQLSFQGESQMDQTTATILSASAIVLSALLASLITLYGTNHATTRANTYALSLEQLRLEAERVKTKTERMTQAIEEVYEGLLSMDRMCQAFAADRRRPDVILDAPGRLKERQAAEVRLQTLIRLYLPSLQHAFDDYAQQLDRYWQTITHSPTPGFGLAKVSGASLEQGESTKAENDYAQRLNGLLLLLQAMVK
jgi:hypothetical protein